MSNWVGWRRWCPPARLHLLQGSARLRHSMRKELQRRNREFYNSHTLKTKLPSAKSYTSNTYSYFITCLRREETAVGENTIETHMWSVVSSWTNSPHWPFQCFIKILFTFVAEVCVGEDPKILYINTERMCQNGRNSLCNRKANDPELQRERRTR